MGVGDVDWSMKTARKMAARRGMKVRPYRDLTKEHPKFSSNLSGSTDMVDVITPVLGDVFVCESCLRKFAHYDGLVLEPVTVVLGGEKCTFCGKPLWPKILRGEKVFRVRRIQLTLPEIWHYLGKKKGVPKYEGSKIW